MEPNRLAAFEAALFAHARPRTVIVTTPNREYNVTFENMPEGRLRRPDNRFEWTRKEFEDWAKGVAERNRYMLQFEGIGDMHPEHGAPTQMGIFGKAAP